MLPWDVIDDLFAVASDAECVGIYPRYSAQSANRDKAN